MMLRLIGIGTVFALVAVSYALLLTKSALDTERLHHAATATERDHWKAAAEAYRADAEAQAENARRCLAREAQVQRDAAERDSQDRGPGTQPWPLGAHYGQGIPDGCPVAGAGTLLR